MQSIHNKIVKRIRGMGKGSVFVVSDFLDIALSENIKKILLRLTNNGYLQRLCPGIYYFPKKSTLLKTDLSPRIDKVAEAVARKNRMKIVISEPLAANLLRLTTQVPAKNVFLTDGKTREMSIGKQQITFKYATPKVMGLGKQKGGIVVQALKYLGEKRSSHEILQQLKKTLPKKVKSNLNGCLPYAPIWMHPLLKDIASGACKKD